jgi:hypothetical protein
VADNPSQEGETPRQVATVTPPQDLYPTSDIRFVLIELGKVSNKIDGLTEAVGKQGTKIDAVERTVDRARTTVIVAAVILSAVGAIFWWALGDRITSAVHTGLFPTEAPRPPPPR